MFTGKMDAEPEAPIFWSSMGTVDSLEKSMILGKFEGRRRRGNQGIR